MSKTFHIGVNFDITAKFDDTTLAEMQEYIKSRKHLPAGFLQYIQGLDDDAALVAFIKHNVNVWFKGELEQQRKRDRAFMQYSPVRVQIQEKAH